MRVMVTWRGAGHIARAGPGACRQPSSVSCPAPALVRRPSREWCARTHRTDKVRVCWMLQANDVGKCHLKSSISVALCAVSVAVALCVRPAPTHNRNLEDRGQPLRCEVCDPDLAWRPGSTRTVHSCALGVACWPGSRGFSLDLHAAAGRSSQAGDA